MSTPRLVAALSFSLSLGLLVGCQTTTQSGAVGANRAQLMLVSSAQLEQLALQSYTKMRAEAAQNHTLNADAAMLRRVQSIAGHLEPETAVFRRDAPAWKWEVNLIDSKELNAFCMPGGKIMVYSGLVDQLKLSNAEIAIVLGHEIAHALREHAREQVSQAIAAQAAIDVGATLFGASASSVDLTRTAYQALVATKFSRIDEEEADRIGLELSARAGYDPRAGVTVWQKMIAARQGGRPPEFLSTHPAESSRIRDIQSLLPTVVPLYEAAPARR